MDTYSIERRLEFGGALHFHYYNQPQISVEMLPLPKRENVDMTTDRNGRDRLAACIERYLSDEITAFQFDEEIHEIGQRSIDATVFHVANLLWYHYDDCVDHKVVLSKEQWDYFQRLVFLLRSEAHLTVERKKHFSFAQLIAAACLAGFGYCAAMLGLGQHLLLVAVAFGLPSIGISFWRNSILQKSQNYDIHLIPFSSICQVAGIHRSLASFRKRQFPRGLASRRIRDPRDIPTGAIARYAAWFLLSPIVLCYQMSPVVETTTRVVTP
jgi:hypothetical protein